MKFGSTKAMVEGLKHHLGIDLSYGEPTRRYGGGMIVPTSSLAFHQMRDLKDFAHRTGSIEVQEWSGWQTLVNRVR